MDGKFQSAFNFAFFVDACRTQKLEPVDGFICACEIGAAPYYPRNV